VAALTIRDVLDRPSFQKARILTGSESVHRQVKWVHILEVTQFQQLLNGGELILTTGLQWRKNGKKGITFLKELIAAKVSGLCVEVINIDNGIPQEMLEYARRHQFPIIIFEEEVRFIDLTQDVNMILMNSQYQLLSDLEEFSQKLNHTLLLPNSFKRVLRLLHEYLDVQVLYLAKNREEIVFIPPVNERNKRSYLSMIDAYHENGLENQSKHFHAPNMSFVGQPIQAFGRKLADLIIFPELKPISEYELLVLDRCATAISQDLLRLLYMEESRKQKEQQWVHAWLKKKHHREEIQVQLSTLGLSEKPNGATVCICRMSEYIDDSSFSYYLVVFRDIFEQYGFFVVAAYEAKQVVLILLNRRGTNWKERLQSALNHLRQIDIIKSSTKRLAFGVGAFVSELEKVPYSYQTAKETLYIQENANLPHEQFYEDFHVYRLVSVYSKLGGLEEFVEEYLGAVIAYDNEHKNDLLQTLIVIMESNGSKKMAAEKLHIVRQTLYHRLEKLQELLGDDFMEARKRVTIEFALYGYRFLNPDKKGIGDDSKD
jgi:purine catabolism regulator